jgi:hypothetical protein
MHAMRDLWGARGGEVFVFDGARSRSAARTALITRKPGAERYQGPSGRRERLDNRAYGEHADVFSGHEIVALRRCRRKV